MTKKKVVVVGNCQAMPIATLLEKMSDEIEVTKVAIVHLLKSEQEDEYKHFFEEADHLIVQAVSSNYPCEFVRTDSLKNKYGSKVTIILNLFYSGYTPDWFYIRQPGRPTLRGPMGDYHNKTIFDAWRSGVDQSNAIKLVEDINYNSNRYLHELDKSLLQLKRREAAVDVHIFEYIKKNLMGKRLFFTFNHPTLDLLIEYTTRILSTINIPKINFEFEMGEPLNQYIPDINVGLPFEFNRTGCYHGNKVLEIDGWNVEAKSKEVYELGSIVDLYYQIYDTNKQSLILLYGESI
jgi:hypothetical protein